MKISLLRPFILALAPLLVCSPKARAQVNYDESKVPQYELPDVLLCSDGTRVTTVEEWEQKRRPELLDLFAQQEYGYTPEDAVDVTYDVVAEKSNALDGLATAQQVMFTFSGRGQKVRALALVYYPNQREGRVPVFIGLNFEGNHNVTTDTWVQYSPYFDRMTNRQDPLLNRGRQTVRWPLKTIIRRGYAVVTMCYNDIFPDNADGQSLSVVPLLPRKGNLANCWKAIGAWAWGYSRIADWVVQQSWANPRQMASVGLSRLGKASLWAGAQDKRFQVVISTCSGHGGAALWKREFGETITSITTSFPHWFNVRFSTYANKAQSLPYDQHELLALVAPRHVYVSSASADPWADPKGEYLSAYHTTPVYELYGMTGFASSTMPDQQQPIHTDIGHHIRTGGHNILEYDWLRYLDFCDRIFAKYPDGVTSLQSPKAASRLDGVAYDLCGRPMGIDRSRLPRGAYIINGKKTLIR